MNLDKNPFENFRRKPEKQHKRLSRVIFVGILVLVGRKKKWEKSPGDVWDQRRYPWEISGRNPCMNSHRNLCIKNPWKIAEGVLKGSPGEILWENFAGMPGGIIGGTLGGIPEKISRESPGVVPNASIQKKFKRNLWRSGRGGAPRDPRAFYKFLMQTL